MFNSEAVLFRKYLEMLKLLHIYLNHFPKCEKYGLCQSIRNDAYKILDYIIEGQKRYYKKTSLTELDIAHERLRQKSYLAYELGYFGYKNGIQDNRDSQKLNAERFQKISVLIDALGAMIGAWIKSQRESQ
jgi:hypothetical protein